MIPPNFNLAVSPDLNDLLRTLLIVLWPAGLLLLVPTLVGAGARVLLKRRLRRAGMAEIDRMDGRSFEAYLAMLFRRLGYRVFQTAPMADFGGDLLLEKAGSRIVVQAKRWRGPIGLKAVQEVVAARGYYRVADAWVMTNSAFTRPARTLARANGVTLIDRDGLVRLILAARDQD